MPVRSFFDESTDCVSVSRGGHWSGEALRPTCCYGNGSPAPSCARTRRRF